MAVEELVRLTIRVSAESANPPGPDRRAGTWPQNHNPRLGRVRQPTGSGPSSRDVATKSQSASWPSPPTHRVRTVEQGRGHELTIRVLAEFANPLLVEVRSGLAAAGQPQQVVAPPLRIVQVQVPQAATPWSLRGVRGRLLGRRTGCWCRSWTALRRCSRLSCRR